MVMVKQFSAKKEDLRRKISTGSRKICGPVASTMGPGGRTVILAKNNNQIITKDGVTVAKFINNLSEDDFENNVIQIIKQSAISTNNMVGDGTTTATVLTDAIIQLSQKYLSIGVSPKKIKYGFDKAVKFILEELTKMSIPVNSLDNIKNIATISANGDKQIGELIATAVDKVGNDGAISIEDAKSFETTLDLVDGFRIESGYLAQAFITDRRRGVAKLENPYILVTDEHVSYVEQVFPALEIAARDSSSLLIVANEIESNSQALAALIMNTENGTMRVVGINAPKYGEEKRGILKDLALTTGATFVTKEKGLQLKDVKINHLGRAKTVEVSKIETVVIDGQGAPEKIEERVELLKRELQQTKDKHICQTIQNRIAKLSSGAAIIKIGGITEVEVTEKYYRVQDALEAVKSSIQGGILPGGGSAFVKIAKKMKNIKISDDEERIGFEIIKNSIEYPFKTIAKNADMNSESCLEKLKKYNKQEGYDFSKKSFEKDMVKSGIIDPTKVTKSALINAVSTASTLITADYAIIEKE